MQDTGTARACARWRAATRRQRASTEAVDRDTPCSSCSRSRVRAAGRCWAWRRQAARASRRGPNCTGLVTTVAIGGVSRILAGWAVGWVPLPCGGTCRRWCRAGCPTRTWIEVDETWLSVGGVLWPWSWASRGRGWFTHLAARGAPGRVCLNPEGRRLPGALWPAGTTRCATNATRTSPPPPTASRAGSAASSPGPPDAGAEDRGPEAASATGGRPGRPATQLSTRLKQCRLAESPPGSSNDENS